VYHLIRPLLQRSRNDELDDGEVRALEVFASVWVRGADVNLWLEFSPFAKVLPTRQQIDVGALVFQPLDINDVVRRTDGTLWWSQGRLLRWPRLVIRSKRS
jgi:hypothetical protein